jgi:ABC-type sugar transport system, permease component
MDKSAKRPGIGGVVAVVLMLAVLVIVFYPFLWLVISSFKVDEDIVKYPPTFFATHFTVLSYVQVWQSIPLLSFLKNTVIFAGSVTVISVIFDSMAGYAFARMSFKGKNLLFTLVLITMMIPFQVLMIPLFLEVYKFNLLNTYAGLILPRMADAFGIFLMRSFFVSLPKDLEEAGRVDGFNEFQIFFKIMFPLCKPAIITLAVFNLMANWNDLLYPLMLTSKAEMRTLSAGLAMFVGQRTLEYGPTLAASVIAMLPLIVVYLFGQKYFVQGAATTGLKA